MNGWGINGCGMSGCGASGGMDEWVWWEVKYRYGRASVMKDPILPFKMVI
jgi:hypothetical protein